MGVAFGWGGAPQSKSEGFRFTSALNSARLALVVVRLSRSSLTFGPLILVAEAKILEDAAQFTIRFFEAGNELAGIFT